MTASERELTATEAAQWAGVSRATINGWIQQGHLPTTLVGSRRRIRLADLATTLQQRQTDAILPWRADPVRAGQRLRAMREAAGWTQQQLAARAGVSHEAISNLELARRTPQPASIHALAAALDVPPERFVDHSSLGLSLLTVTEAASVLDVPAGRVQAWLRRGQLAGRKVGGQWRVLAITVAELERSGRLRGQSRRLDPRFKG